MLDLLMGLICLGLPLALVLLPVVLVLLMGFFHPSTRQYSEQIEMNKKMTELNDNIRTMKERR